MKVITYRDLDYCLGMYNRYIVSGNKRMANKWLKTLGAQCKKYEMQQAQKKLKI